jgi:hypothetical protein
MISACIAFDVLFKVRCINVFITLQERANYHFSHFWKNEVGVYEQQIAIMTQI